MHLRPLQHRLLILCIVVSAMPTDANAAPLSAADAMATWDQGALTTHLPNAFQALVHSFSTLWSMPAEVSHGIDPNQAGITVITLLAAVIWLVPRLPTHVALRRWLGH